MKFISLIILSTILSCSTKVDKTQKPTDLVSKVSNADEQYIEFTFDNTKYRISGKADINSDFYSKKWPGIHTLQSIKKNRLDNQNIFCGRIANNSNTQMVELFFNYSKGTKLKLENIKDEINKKRYTFNYNRKENKSIDNNFRFYFFNTVNEYTSDDESEGYILVDKINNVTDSTITAEGVFKLNVREYGKSELHIVNGRFNLEFYIGI